LTFALFWFNVYLFSDPILWSAYTLASAFSILLGAYILVSALYYSFSTVFLLWLVYVFLKPVRLSESAIKFHVYKEKLFRFRFSKSPIKFHFYKEKVFRFKDIQYVEFNVYSKRFTLIDSSLKSIDIPLSLVDNHKELCEQFVCRGVVLKTKD